jgi:protocatechuate 3,4-dioxygenase beta subunit
MKKIFVSMLLLGLLTACAGTPTETQLPPPAARTPLPASVTPTISSADASTPAPAATTTTMANDIFTQNGIALPAPTCTTLTQPQTEGPYYTANSPEKHSLLEEGMTGTRLILVGYVLDQNCQPLSNAWLDFWQADANGEYDNTGYRLRGHQFTDSQGRYYLETVLPGIYESRPIRHIHVKVKPEGGAEVTSQLYFPDQPIEGLTVTTEDRGDYLVGYFNFVVQN